MTTTALYAGKPAVLVTNVSQPTLPVYSPKGTNTGVAVVVFPGGGYRCLAIDLEGTEICEWLASREITGVLLKYRVPFSGQRSTASPQKQRRRCRMPSERSGWCAFMLVEKWLGTIKMIPQ